MSELIYIICIIAGACIGWKIYGYYRRWRFDRSLSFRKGDRITIMSSNGDETYTIKGVKKTTMTLDDKEYDSKRSAN